MTAWPDLDDDLRRVLEHPGFVEISNWPAFIQPWAVGVRFDGLRITWFRAESLSTALTQAVCAMERLGSATPYEKETSYRTHA